MNHIAIAFAVKDSQSTVSKTTTSYILCSGTIGSDCVRVAEKGSTGNVKIV
jgi:hypothetical protein